MKVKTLATFLKVFKKLAKTTEWHVKDDAILTKNGHCPACFVASVLGENTRSEKTYPWNTDLFRSQPELANRIVSLADNVFDTTIPDFLKHRKEMLRAAGLPEK